MTLRIDPEGLPWHAPVVEEVSLEHMPVNDPLGNLSLRQLFFRCVWASKENSDVRLTLFCIARFFDDDACGSSMSYAQIARDCGFSEATAKRTVRAARDRWLRVEVGAGRVRPGGAENRYAGICPPDVAERLRTMARQTNHGVSGRHPSQREHDTPRRCHTGTPCIARGVTETPPRGVNQTRGVRGRHLGVSGSHTDSGSTQDLELPPTPQRQSRRGERGRGYSREEWVVTLRSEEGTRHVVDSLIVSLVPLIEHDSPIVLLKEIRDHPTFADYPDHALRHIGQHVAKVRKKIISVKCVLDQVGPALVSCPNLLIGPQSPSWGAWLDHWRETGNSSLATYYEKQRHARVFSEWPRGHARYSSKAPVGRVA